MEHQATDRACRIAETKNIQVHKFLCAGTLEERIDEMIEHKKELAERRSAPARRAFNDRAEGPLRLAEGGRRAVGFPSRRACSARRLVCVIIVREHFEPKGDPDGWPRFSEPGGTMIMPGAATEYEFMPSVYIETTVPSYYYETRSSPRIAAWRDVTRALDAFRGFSYPFAGPTPCP